MEFVHALHPLGMKQINHLSIPSPCTQSWDNMTPDTQGRFCGSCQKSVVDFSGLSNQQILNQLSLSSLGKVCGRFNETQSLVLNSEIARVQPAFAWQKFGIAATLIAVLPFVNVQAKMKPPVEQSPVKHDKTEPALDTNVVYKRISGRIISKTDTQSIAGVTVRVKGGNNAVASDVNGNFAIMAPVTANTVLTFSFIGFKNTDLKLDANKTTGYTVQLQENYNTLMGELVIIRRPPLWKRPYYAVRRVVRRVFK